MNGISSFLSSIVHADKAVSPNRSGRIRPVLVYVAIVLLPVLELGTPAQAQRISASVSTGLGGGPQAMAVNPTTNKIYVGPAYGGNTVAVIDGGNPGSTPKLVQTDEQPTAFAIDRTNNQIYVLNSLSDRTSAIWKIDGNTNAARRLAVFRETIGRSNSIAVLPGSNNNPRIYASQIGTGKVFVIDANTGSQSALQVGDTAGRVLANPDNGKVYVSAAGKSAQEPKIVVLREGAVVTNIPLTDARLRGLALNPQTKKVYVLLLDAVVEVDGTSDAATSIALSFATSGDRATGLAVDATKNKVYALSERGQLFTIDGATRAATSQQFDSLNNSQGLAVNGAGTRLYAIHGTWLVNVVDLTAGTSTTMEMVGSYRPPIDTEDCDNIRPYVQAIAAVTGTNNIFLAGQTSIGCSDSSPGTLAGDVTAIDDSATPWPAVRVDRIELVQSVQDMDQTVPLIGDKPTLVRVFLSGGPIPRVGGMLRVGDPNRLSSVVASANDNVPVQSAPGDMGARRGMTDSSLNFYLPPRLRNRRFDTVWLGWPTDAAGGSVRCENCKSVTRDIGFAAPLEMRLRVVGVRYAAGTPSTNFEPRQIDYDLLQSWLKRAYPISKLTFSNVILTTTGLAQPFGCETINAVLTAMRNQDVTNGTDQRTHYYGMVLQDARAGSFFMRGCSTDIPASADPSIVASGPTGPTGVAFPWDTDQSWGDWYGAHEIGHTFGRFHAGPATSYVDYPVTNQPPIRVMFGPCNERGPDPNWPSSDPAGQIGPTVVGFDLGDKPLNLSSTARKPPQAHDVMSYCENQWIGKYTYLGLMDRLRAEDALGASPAVSSQPVASVTPGPSSAGAASRAAAGPAPAAGSSAQTAQSPGQPAPSYLEGDFITIVGTANVGQQTATIDFVNRVQRAKVRPASADSPVRLRAFDQKGQVISGLSDMPVVFLQNTHSEPGQVKGVIEAVLPARSDLKAIEILIGGKIAARYEAPAQTNLRPTELRSTPLVRSPGVGASPAQGRPHQLSWGAQPSSAPANPAIRGVRYDIQASGDGGRTWQTLAVGVEDPNAQVDLAPFKDAREVEVRVIANSGFESKVIARRTIRR